MFVLILFCAVLILCVLLDFSILYALVAGFFIFLVYGKTRGFTWRELIKITLTGVAAVKSILIVFILIGMLTALWRLCGTVPLIICYAVDTIKPGTVLLMAFLLNCAVSVLTGTAFGTAATMGTICMSVALSMGVSPVMAGGAILAGSFFGDRCSPVSTSALLVSQLTDTNIYDNIREMVRSAAVPFIISCGIYAAIGIFSAGSGEAVSLWDTFSREFVLKPVALIPAALILILSVCRVNVKLAMSAGIASAAVICIFYLKLPIVTVIKTAFSGFTAADAEIGSMLNGGGILSMVRVTAIVCISCAYAGIFRETGILDGLRGTLENISRKTVPFASMAISALFASMISCNQTLAIILTHQLCADTEPDNKSAASDLENSAVIMAPLIPWAIASGVPLTTVGAPTVSILFAFFLYITPIYTFAVKMIKKK